MADNNGKFNFLVIKKKFYQRWQTFLVNVIKKKKRKITVYFI